MRTGKSLWMLFAVLLGWATIVSAQNGTPPDLSGSWKMNAAKSKLSKKSTIQSETVVIKQVGSQVEFDYDIDGKRSSRTYTTDKKEKVISEVEGGKIAAKAYWKKAMLVIETRGVVELPTSPLSNYEVFGDKSTWTLSDDGTVLTEKSVVSNVDSTVTVYDRQ